MQDLNQILLAFLFCLELCLIAVFFVFLYRQRYRKQVKTLDRIESGKTDFAQYLSRKTKECEEKAEAVKQNPSTEDDLEAKALLETHAARHGFYKNALVGFQKSEGDHRGFFDQVSTHFEKTTRQKIEEKRKLQLARGELVKQQGELKASMEGLKGDVERMKEEKQESGEEIRKLKEQYQGLVEEKETLAQEFSKLETAHRTLQQDFETMEKEYMLLFNKAEKEKKD